MLPVQRKARYVAVQAYHQGQYFCSDEIAVVKGADDLPLLQPDPAAKVAIVTSGVGFAPSGAGCRSARTCRSRRGC